MALTPADVHNVAFSRARVGKRGYSEQEVDLFIDLVEQELIRHIEEDAELRHRNAELARPPRKAVCGHNAGLFVMVTNVADSFLARDSVHQMHHSAAG